MATVSRDTVQKNNGNKKMTSRFLLGILLSALSGVMLLLSFPPTGSGRSCGWASYRIFLPSTA